MMTKFTPAVRTVLIAAMIAGLSGCEDEKASPPAPISPLTVGGSASGLAAGGELVLQLNEGNDLTVKADGKFKFPKALSKGSSYAVTVKTSPALPVKQTCTVSQDSGKIVDKEVTNVAVTCTTNNYAVGGTVSGLTGKIKGKGKGLILVLKDENEVEITKNGNFVFPNTRMPDGSDYNVAIKATPAGQKCVIEAVNTAPDSDTLNIVSITCSKKGRK
jgi:hypothetical protein